MDPYQKLVKERNITHLCHFTKSSNLPYIFGDEKFEKNGIVSTSMIENSNYLEKLDSNRYDNHKDYVCTSVQYINNYYYERVKEKNKDENFSEWVVILINPKVISENSLFCPINSASEKGKYIKSGIDAFESLFAPKVIDTHKRCFDRKCLASNVPTDRQAEVLIKDRISKDMLLGVAFPEETCQVEKLRMSFWTDQKIKIYSWKDVYYG